MDAFSLADKKEMQNEIKILPHIVSSFFFLIQILSIQAVFISKYVFSNSSIILHATFLQLVLLYVCPANIILKFLENHLPGKTFVQDHGVRQDVITIMPGGELMHST